MVVSSPCWASSPFREGAETVIFYESIYSMSQDSRRHMDWRHCGRGRVADHLLRAAFHFGEFDRPVLLVTSILMAVVVIFAGGGIHALIEGDLIEGTYLSNVPTNDWIGLYPYVECLWHRRWPPSP